MSKSEAVRASAHTDETGHRVLTVVRRGELYPIAEGETLPGDLTRTMTRARWTGEHRSPRRGEWFLSGAVVEAYRARYDMTDDRAMHIAELVAGRVVFDQPVPRAED